VTVIVVTGGECTGKTTLARELARRLDVPWAEEAARAVAERTPTPLGPEHVEVIARLHVRNADEAIRRAEATGRPAVVLDQDLLSTVVYARLYYGQCPVWIEEAARARRADLYLLCHPDLPWSADGVRDRPAARAEIHALFAEALARAGARVVPVEGRGAEREDRAEDSVRRLLLTG